jgi:parvulin-like peptidyl-prolyl isomerase
VVVKKPKAFVIKISGNPIFEEEFERLFIESNSEHENLKGDEYYINTMKKDFAYNFADEMLLYKLASASGIRVNPEELSDELELIKNGYTKETFDEMLKSEELTLEKLEVMTRKRLLLKKVLDEKIYSGIIVTDDEIKEFYRRFKSSFFVPDEYKIDKITVEDETRAKEVYEKLTKKKRKARMDFKKAKERYSLVEEDEDETEKREYFPRSGLPEEFDNALEGLKEGKITPIINTAKGYHILKLIDIRKGHTPSIDKVKAKIERLIRERKEKKAYGSFMKDYRKEKGVVVNDEYFEVQKDES